MINRNGEHPACYGILEQVFPRGEDGLRHSPESCMVCCCKTECLRKALSGKAGLKAKEEMTDRAYTAGAIGFFERWSRRKSIDRRSRESRLKAED